MPVEIVSSSISTKVWDRARIQLVTPGLAVRLASVARNFTDCATRPGADFFLKYLTGIPSVSNSLDPDLHQHFVGSELGQNCCKSYQQWTDYIIFIIPFVIFGKIRPKKKYLCLG